MSAAGGDQGLKGVLIAGTAALVSFAAAPRATRWVATLMTVVAASDALQYGFAALEKSEG